MKLTITLGELRSAIENKADQFGNVRELSPLNKLANASLSAKMMFQFGNTAEDARTKHKGVTKQMDDLLAKYGTPAKEKTPTGEEKEITGQFTFEIRDADGKPDGEMTKRNRAAYDAELDELLATTVQIDARTFTIDELEKYESKLEMVRFNGNDMRALNWLIIAPEEKAAPKPVESIAEHQAAKAAVGD